MNSKCLGPVVRSIVSLTSSLVVKMLTILVSTISNSQVFLLKNVKCKSYSHFFSKNISIHPVFNDQRFNDTLTNDSISFEHLGPGWYFERAWDESKSVHFVHARRHLFPWRCPNISSYRKWLHLVDFPPFLTWETSFQTSYLQSCAWIPFWKGVYS